MTVNSGRCAARFAGSFSGRNMLRANRLCQANSLTTRIGSLYFGSVPRPGVEDVELLVLQVRHHVAVQRVELRLVDRPVHAAPVHVLFARRLADDELVVRRAAGVLAGAGDQRAFGGQLRLAAAKRLLVQGGRAQVPVDASRPNDPKGFETVRPLNLYGHAVRLPSVADQAVRSVIGWCNVTEAAVRRKQRSYRSESESSQPAPVQRGRRDVAGRSGYSVARANVSPGEGKQPSPAAVFQ